MRFTGILKSWDDARGFGFITPDQGGQEVFVHIKAFTSVRGRPAAGQPLSFEVETTPQGKKRATAVRLAAANGGTHTPSAQQSSTERPAAWSPLRLAAFPAFFALLAYLALRWGLRPQVLLVYGAVSLLTFFAYVVDKNAAVAGRWRIPESTLHGLALAGGWPGALLGQQLLRHKTSKLPFVLMFWSTVATNLILLVLWHAGLLQSVGT